MTTVYWIHLPEHTDITKEGYVGITDRSVEHRFYQHKNTASNGSKYVFSNAIRKYGDKLIAEEVLRGDRDYCLLIEEKLRPVARIGWNTVRGGDRSCPPAGIRWAAEGQRERHSAIMKARGMSPEAEKALRKYNDETPPWQRAFSVKDTWAKADEIYSGFLSVDGAKTPYKISKEFGVSIKSARNLIKHFKEEWNPSQDTDWLMWANSYKKEKELNNDHS